MNVDDATGEPINECVDCHKEVIGYVDDPHISFYCDDCKGDEEWKKQENY